MAKPSKADKKAKRKARRQQWGNANGQKGGTLRSALNAALKAGHGDEIANNTGIRLADLQRAASSPAPIRDDRDNIQAALDALEPLEA